jgi:hypothetical protein
MRRRSLVISVLGAAALLVSGHGVSASPAAAASAPAANAKAQEEAVVEVSVLHGRHDRATPDSKSFEMPELREGPFAKYARYELLSQVALPLTRGGKRQLRLPNGRTLEARLDAKLPDGSLRLVASINRPDGKELLPLLEVKARAGQSFIVAGQSYRRGILVLVFKVIR